MGRDHTGKNQKARGVANPLAAILSGVMLLDHLADTRDDPAPRAAARRIESAVAAALSCPGECIFLEEIESSGGTT